MFKKDANTLHTSIYDMLYRGRNLTLNNFLFQKNTYKGDFSKYNYDIFNIAVCSVVWLPNIILGSLNDFWAGSPYFAS